MKRVIAAAMVAALLSAPSACQPTSSGDTNPRKTPTSGAPVPPGPGGITTQATIDTCNFANGIYVAVPPPTAVERGNDGSTFNSFLQDQNLDANVAAAVRKLLDDGGSTSAYPHQVPSNGQKWSSDMDFLINACHDAGWRPPRYQ